MTRPWVKQPPLVEIEQVGSFTRDLDDCEFVELPIVADLYKKYGPVDPSLPVSVTVKEYTEIVLAMGRCVSPYSLIVGPHGGLLVMGCEILPAGA